jgi:hypothetical protein
MKQPTNYPLRLTDAVKEAVKRKAANERRSVNRQIEMALVEDLVRSGYLPAPQHSEAAA